jgi:hypothetical protein
MKRRNNKTAQNKKKKNPKNRNSNVNESNPFLEKKEACHYCHCFYTHAYMSGKLESKVAAAEVQCEINWVKLDLEPADVKLDSKPAVAHIQYWEDHWSGIPHRVTCHAATAKVKCNLCADFRAEEI